MPVHEARPSKRYTSATDAHVTKIRTVPAAAVAGRLANRLDVAQGQGRRLADGHRLGIEQRGDPGHGLIRHGTHIPQGQRRTAPHRPVLVLERGNQGLDRSLRSHAHRFQRADGGTAHFDLDV